MMFNSHSVGPDWAIFKALGDFFCYKSSPKLLGYFENIHFYLKTALATFGQFFKTFSYFLFHHLVTLFPTEDHTREGGGFDSIDCIDSFCSWTYTLMEVQASLWINIAVLTFFYMSHMFTFKMASQPLVKERQVFLRVYLVVFDNNLRSKPALAHTDTRQPLLTIVGITALPPYYIF